LQIYKLHDIIKYKGVEWGDKMSTMYSATINSPSTEISTAIDDITSFIQVKDISLIPSAPNLLTIGYDTNSPETILLLNKAGDIIEVQRGFEGIQKP
jgi:hypothetical protein